jgi:hypothetical protein
VTPIPAAVQQGSDTLTTLDGHDTLLVKNVVASRCSPAISSCAPNASIGTSSGTESGRRLKLDCEATTIGTRIIRVA